MSDLRIGSLCSGYGGLEMGLQSVIGGTVAWHVEYDDAPSKILHHHHPDVPNYGDLTTLDHAALEPVDWLTAGYPCQPFSKTGRRRGAQDARHLWPHVADTIGALRPRRVFLENVADHVSLGLDAVVGDLASLGYDAQWGVVSASEAGAPHGRPRVFILTADARGVIHAPARPAVVAAAAASQPAPAGAQREHRPGSGHDEDEGAADPRDFGPYADAVRRWGPVVGRPAPVPLLERAGAPDLNPVFVEWVMGLPHGWVTGVPGISVHAQLKALGNGVVPQQAALALRMLLNLSEVAA